MNAPLFGINAFGFKAPPPPGHRIVEAVRAFAGHPYISSPDRAACFDCTALVIAITGREIPADWARHGGRLPFVAIGLDAARPGDLLVLMDADRWLMAVMTDGDSVADPRARIFTVRRCRAAAEMWLTPALKTSLISAYRLPLFACRDVDAETAFGAVKTASTFPHIVPSKDKNPWPIIIPARR